MKFTDTLAAGLVAVSRIWTDFKAYIILLHIKS